MMLKQGVEKCFFSIFLKWKKMDKFLLKISEEKENIIVLSQSPESIGKFPHPCQENIIIIIECYGGVNVTIAFPFLSVF